MIPYQRNHRYAFLAKTRAGKTFAMVIVSARLVPAHPWEAAGWECWWIDTKHGPDDQRMLWDWGYRSPTSPIRTARRVFTVTGSRQEMQEHISLIIDAAMRRHRVLVAIDEYQHAQESRLYAGPALEDLHKRGGGLDVGIIGGVQEPAFTARQLFSQATHLWIGNLTHLRDVKTARELCPGYAPGWPQTPDTVPDQHGFHVKWLDGHGNDGRWVYYSSVQEWDRHRRRRLTAGRASAK